MKLLPTQKNVLYDLIEAQGMSPSLFDIREAKDRKTGRIDTNIVYGKSNYFFSLQQGSRDILLHYSPGPKTYDERRVIVSPDNINDAFIIWLICLKREINVVDKWERLTQEIKQIDISYNDEIDKFSAAEYEDLKIKLNVLKAEIKSLALSPTQLQAIETKIDHLADVAISLSKFDWKSLFVGTLVSVIIQLSISQENGKALWDIIKKVFNQYFLSQ